MSARSLLALALACLLTACSPSSPSAPLSPLPTPIHATSPLPPPSAPRTAVLARNRGYMPLAQTAAIVLPEDGCSANATAAYMLSLIRESSWQQRAQVICDPRLAAAAQAKANEMLALRYFSHTSPNGDSPNDYVRAFGYELPEWYAPGGNQIESIGLNFYPPEAMVLAWAFSPSHGPHVAGTHPFHAAQTCAGAGYVRGPGSDGVYYVFLSAPCN